MFVPNRLSGASWRIASLLCVAAFALLSVLWGPAAHAAALLPISQSFTESSAPGWMIGGGARLTGGQIDPAGQGWLRLTPTERYQAGYAYYDTPLSSSEGIIATFDYAMWGGSGGDGLAFFLMDGAIPTTSPFRLGRVGGSLGYANGCYEAGITGGYVGIGFDEYGHFADPVDNCHHGGSGQIPGVTLRGSGNGMAGYKYLASAPVGTILGDRATYRSVIVTLTSNKMLTVRVRFGPSGPYTTVIDSFKLAAAPGQARFPATFKLGFVAGTGGSTNYYEIRNLKINLPSDLAVSATGGQMASLPPSIAPRRAIVLDESISAMRGFHRRGCLIAE